MPDIEIEIDGKKLAAKPGQTVIQVADDAGIYIPRFCYHKLLSVAANCRMCLVEVEKSPKALPACATPVMPGMKAGGMKTDINTRVTPTIGPMSSLIASMLACLGVLPRSRCCVAVWQRPGSSFRGKSRYRQPSPRPRPQPAKIFHRGPGPVRLN